MDGPPYWYREKNKRVLSNITGLGYFVYHTSRGGSDPFMLPPCSVLLQLRLR